MRASDGIPPPPLLTPGPTPSPPAPPALLTRAAAAEPPLDGGYVPAGHPRARYCPGDFSRARTTPSALTAIRLLHLTLAFRVLHAGSLPQLRRALPPPQGAMTDVAILIDDPLSPSSRPIIPAKQVRNTQKLSVMVVGLKLCRGITKARLKGRMREPDVHFLVRMYRCHRFQDVNLDLRLLFCPRNLNPTTYFSKEPFFSSLLLRPHEYKREVQKATNDRSQIEKSIAESGESAPPPLVCAPLRDTRQLTVGKDAKEGCEKLVQS